MSSKKLRSKVLRKMGANNAKPVVKTNTLSRDIFLEIKSIMSHHSYSKGVDTKSVLSTIRDIARLLNSKVASIRVPIPLGSREIAPVVEIKRGKVQRRQGVESTEWGHHMTRRGASLGSRSMSPSYRVEPDEIEVEPTEGYEDPEIEELNTEDEESSPGDMEEQIDNMVLHVKGMVAN